MADILFVTWDGGGNVPPALGIAAELRRRNHAVRFLGHAQQRDTIASAGFGFTPYANARPWSSTEPSVGPAGAAKAFSMFTDRGPGVDLLAAVEREPADLVVLDCMSLGALHAAERAGLRRAVLVHTYWRFLTHYWSRGPIGLIARLRGQNPMRLWASADLVLVATDRDLDPAHDTDLPPTLRHVGVVQPQPAPVTIDAHAPPRVLVSLSTVNYPGQDKALRSIIAALAELPVHAVVTTGPAVDPSRLNAPPHIELHCHLPHAEVMPGVCMVIGHGGHATTMRALAHDLPLIVMPMHPMLDQKMIGNSVQSHGAAKVLPKSTSVEQIRAAVENLLPRGPHSEAAARLGSRLRAQDGAIIGANHVCALLPTSDDVHTMAPPQPAGPM